MSEAKYDMDRSAKTLAFLERIEELCKIFNLSLSHEDHQGSFIVRDYNNRDSNWLAAAADETK